MLLRLVDRATLTLTTFSASHTAEFLITASNWHFFLTNIRIFRNQLVTAMPPSICGICKKECTSVTCLLKWFVLLKSRSSSSIETLFVSRLAFLKAYAYLKLFGCLKLYILILTLLLRKPNTFYIYYLFIFLNSYIISSQNKKYWNSKKGPCIHLRHRLGPKHSKNCYIGGKIQF